MQHDSDHRARQLAELQHGLLTAAQAHGVGLNHNAVAHRVAAGNLRWVTRRVLAVVGSPATPHQTLLAIVLDAGPGAALSHSTALAHWGVRGFVPDPMHVVRHRAARDHPVQRATVHEVRYLPRDQVRTLEGIAVVSPSLALLQLASMASVSTTRLARAVDAAWADRLVGHATLSGIAQRMSRQGRRGIVRFRTLVEERGPGYLPPASNLEARFAAVLERAGRPSMLRQVDCSSEEGWIGRVDFRDATAPLVVEVQSERFHKGLTAERADLERIERLQQSGLEVLEISDVDLFRRPDSVIADVDAARARAVARRAA